ncbi:uncharacterized protein SOCE836_046340 [Sorangium cellulosum]|uniref:Secreted protein n=1 Tax=Sorangium cellulosum TaxID=56 RepID=A0A4P2QQL2_SORCE|nr:uncharacterized protein SOCE836_046340 [Sorangium cellulosum]WCQ91866.1 hypothetical protein NQZ70_04593 [Sorangium sp. Soce836]
MTRKAVVSASTPVVLACALCAFSAASPSAMADVHGPALARGQFEISVDAYGNVVEVNYP